jgi:hypothetical protein
MIDSQLESSMDPIDILMDTFIRLSMQNDNTLLPTDNSDLRKRFIQMTMVELRRIANSLCRSDLKKLLNAKLSKFDINRVEMPPKRIKSEESVSIHGEFKEMIPYLDMTCISQKLANAENKRSLLSVYWKMNEMIMEESRLSGRKYWE